MDSLNLPKPFFVLAPMDDVTDSVFRQVVQECAPADLYFTEFVNADGLQSPGRHKLLKKLKFNEKEGPLIAQIWGREPENFYKTAKEIADGTFARELGLPDGVNFAGVDLNMGCPQKTEVKNGTCSALINDRPRAGELIEAVREGLDGKLPISVKTRVGYNEVDLTWHEFLLNKKLNMLSVHGRTKREMSKVPAHWDLIGEIKKIRDSLSPSTLIVGNGDVRDRAHGLELAEQYGLDGVMIGRGIFHDPFAFAENSPFGGYSREQRIQLYQDHVTLFTQTWQHNERPIHTLNKFCKIYINGFDGAKELREKLMASRTYDELFATLNEAQLTSMPA
jgi:tRNA-dihydrouridine synthase